MESVKDICERIVTNIEKVIRGQSDAIRIIISAFARRRSFVPKLSALASK